MFMSFIVVISFIVITLLNGLMSFYKLMMGNQAKSISDKTLMNNISATGKLMFEHKGDPVTGGSEELKSDNKEELIPETSEKPEDPDSNKQDECGLCMYYRSSSGKDYTYCRCERKRRNWFDQHKMRQLFMRQVAEDIKKADKQRRKEFFTLFLVVILFNVCSWLFLLVVKICFFFKGVFEFVRESAKSIYNKVKGFFKRQK